jgi:hypothetical protein
MNRNPVQSKSDEKLRASRSKAGIALAAMLYAVVTLFVIGAGVLNLSPHNRGFTLKILSDISARCSADAGLTKAFFEMDEKLKVVLRDDSGLPEVTNERRIIAP